jgi:hypothetical protein
VWHELGLAASARRVHTLVARARWVAAAEAVALAAVALQSNQLRKRDLPTLRRSLLGAVLWAQLADGCCCCCWQASLGLCHSHGAAYAHVHMLCIQTHMSASQTAPFTTTHTTIQPPFLSLPPCVPKCTPPLVVLQ